MSEEYNSKIEIELLKKDVNIMTSLCEKFDKTIDKMQEIATNLSRMVSLQEQRLENQEKITAEVQGVLEMRRQEHNSDIKELHSRITTVNRELTEKIEDTEQTILKEIQELRQELKADKSSVGNKLRDIEMWKWTVSGGLALAAFLLAQSLNLGKILVDLLQ